jgi:hypothetical protein
MRRDSTRRSVSTVHRTTSKDPTASGKPVLSPVLRGLFWAATWGVGAGIGVALGGWLTAVGGAGAPGVESLNLFEDVVLLPLLAGGAVFFVHLAGQLIVHVIRRTRSG